MYAKPRPPELNDPHLVSLTNMVSLDGCSLCTYREAMLDEASLIVSATLCHCPMTMSQGSLCSLVQCHRRRIPYLYQRHDDFFLSYFHLHLFLAQRLHLFFPPLPSSNCCEQHLSWLTSRSLLEVSLRLLPLTSSTPMLHLSCSRNRRKLEPILLG